MHADIISWAPHGRCFLIHQPKLFVQVILPNYFLFTKKTSFTRQLNLYGFVRLLSNGPDKGGRYYHEKFLRSKSELCKLIKRIPLKGSKHSLCQDSQQEPKFYSMPYLPKILCNEYALVLYSEHEPKIHSMTSSYYSSASSFSSLSTSSRSITNITKSSEITSSLYLDQLRSNYEEAQSSFAKKVFTSKDNKPKMKVFDVNLNISSHAFDG